jgi:hypothetical protein
MRCLLLRSIRPEQAQPWQLERRDLAIMRCRSSPRSVRVEQVRRWQLGREGLAVRCLSLRSIRLERAPSFGQALRWQLEQGESAMHYRLLSLCSIRLAQAPPVERASRSQLERAPSFGQALRWQLEREGLALRCRLLRSIRLEPPARRSRLELGGSAMHYRLLLLRSIRLAQAPAFERAPRWQLGGEGSAMHRLAPCP